MKRVGNCIIDENFSEICYKEYVIYLKGVFFIDGYRAGEESIRKLVDIYEQTLTIPFAKLRGAFSLVVDNGNTICIFTDNSNQNSMFYCNDFIASRFDSLLHVGKVNVRWDEVAVCEYLSLGKVLFDKTLVNEVSILNSEQYAIMCDGKIEIREKNIGKIYDELSTKFDPITFFEKVAYALQKEKYTNALTGGYDSRLVATQLSKWIEIYPLVCANSQKDIEKMVAEKVCHEMGKKLWTIEIPKPNFDEEWLKKLLEIDDMTPFDLEGNYIQFYFKRKMHEKTLDLFITGDGGVLHKDWEWMQDLPFYHKKHVNLDKFYDQRIEYINYKMELGERMLVYYNEQKKRIIESLKAYIQKTNTESYDCLYYYITGNRRLYYNLTEEKVRMYAPLNEFEYVQFSYHLPRRKRFFNNEIRRLTTEASKYIARIPTNYGTTASAEFVWWFRDIFFQCIEYIKKAIRMFGRKMFNRSFFVSKTIDWDANELRKLEFVQRAMEYAQQNDFISQNAKLENASLAILYRVVHLYYLHTKFQID